MKPMTTIIQRLKPQEGKQEQFVSATADIVLYGGARGGGKTYGLLLEAVRNIAVSGYGAVFFRRSLYQQQQSPT